MSILYKFQINSSSNSREIKYWPDTHTDTHTNRQTDRVKTIPRNPLRGRGNDTRGWLCNRTARVNGPEINIECHFAIPLGFK